MYISNSSSSECYELAEAHSRVVMEGPEIDEDEQEESEEDEEESVDESDQHSGRSTHGIGKLLDLAVYIKVLSRDEIYDLLTVETDPCPTAYPFSQPCSSSCSRRFRPDLVKCWPWSHSHDGVLCLCCVFVLSTRWPKLR